MEGMLHALAERADGPADPEVLLHAAGRVASRFGEHAQQTRDDALDLLVADALTTYAFERGAEGSDSLEDLSTRAFADLTKAPSR
jgi:hypothetical protein